jgi:DNA-binding response OmpR family regulator
MAGADQVLIKPCGIDALVAEARRLLAVPVGFRRTAKPPGERSLG